MLAVWQAESLALITEEISRWGVSKRTVAFMSGSLVQGSGVGAMGLVGLGIIELRTSFSRGEGPAGGIGHGQ
jgi:hypothetical protein